MGWGAFYWSCALDGMPYDHDAKRLVAVARK